MLGEAPYWSRRGSIHCLLPWKEVLALATILASIGSMPAYLFELVGLQQVAGLGHVGLEGFWFQVGRDGRAMFGVHLLFSGDLEVENTVSKEALAV